MPAPSRARRRLGSWTVVAVVAAALGCAAVLGWWIRFAPLQDSGSSGWLIEPTNSAYAFAVQNTGPFDIQVTDIELSPVPGYFWSPQVEVGEPGVFVGDVDEPRHLFEPFTVAPGDERAIILSGRTSCANAAGGRTRSLRAIYVDYKVLGIPRTQRVQLGSDFQLNPLSDVCNPPPPPPPPVFPDPTNSRL
jgi:hypothetical protein